MSHEAKPLGAGLVSCDGKQVALERSGGPPEVVALPPFLGGLGGLELVVSPDERFLAVFRYSGQSSQGFELLALEPALRLIASVPETFGHGDAPFFSPRGELVAMVTDCEHRLSGTDTWFEDVQADAATDRVVVDWGRVWFIALPDGTPRCFTVAVEVPRAMNVDDFFDWAPYDVGHFDSAGALTLALPWGERVSVTLPRTEPLVSTPR